MLTFARAEGTTAFTAALDGQHVDAGHGERGPRPEPLAEPARADERHALLDLRELAELLVAEGRAGPLLALQTLDRDVAVLVVHRRERADDGEERIGAAPPNWPECFGPASVRTSIVTTAIPRRPMVSVGTPGRMLPMSPTTIASAANSSGCVGGYVVNALPVSS